MGDPSIQNTGTSNVAWNKQLADQLDAKDGKKDGKISASVWNDFIEQSGSKGNKIKNSMSTADAMRSLNYYNSTKDKANTS